MNSNEIILHLSLIEGVGAGTIETVIQNKPWDIDLHDLHTMRVNDIVRLFAIPWGKAELIVQGLADKSAINKELELIHRYQVEWITMYHDHYPSLLRHIHLPPAILYVQGTLPSSQDICMAVIGSRKMNSYGARAIETFVPAMVQSGFTIVSGGALGADSAAHTTTLAHAGKTVAVLGSGLLRPYPASNKRLFADIVSSGGALVSPFPLLGPALTGNFPARNRIIAGLSRGCLVVQAAQSSGTHITARYALEQGRELFAIPGPINDELSAGCHSLIQQGATLVTRPADIFEQLGMLDTHANKMTVNHTHKVAAPHAAETTPFKADGPAAIILRTCINPCSIDDLAESTGLLMSQLYTQLFELELAGHIAQQANGLWQRRK